MPLGNDFDVALYLKLVSIPYLTSTEILVLLSQSEQFHQNLLLSCFTNEAKKEAVLQGRLYV